MNADRVSTAKPARLSRLAAVPAILVALAGLTAAVLAPTYFTRVRSMGGIVSLSPSTTETLFALGLGHRLVGVSTYCNYPPEAKALPKMGDYGTPAVESILAARPELVVVSGRGMNRMLKGLERAGIRVYCAPDDSIENIASGFEELGRLAGDAGAGRRLASEFRDRFAKESARTAARAESARPLVFLETWSAPLSTVGGDTFVDELIRAAGGRNVAADLGKGYFAPAVESVIRRDPQAIVITRMGDEGAAAAHALAGRPGWAGVRAVREGRIWADIDPDWLLRPGPRLVRGLEALRARLDEVRAANEGTAR